MDDWTRCRNLMGYDQSGNYSLSASSREGSRPNFKLEMVEGLLQFTANTPFNVEAVKTKQNNQTTIRITVSINSSKTLKAGEQVWNQIQEWGKTSGINSEIDNANVPY